MLPGCLLLIGQVYSAPTLADVLLTQDGDGVNAVAIVGDEVFVVRSKSQHLEVYEALTFQSQCRLELGFIPSCLAACADNDCLYFSQWFKSCIRRVELPLASQLY